MEVTLANMASWGANSVCNAPVMAAGRHRSAARAETRNRLEMWPSCHDSLAGSNRTL